MIVQIIGWFCLVCSAFMGVTCCVRAWCDEEYFEPALLFFVCLICAAICFK